MRWTRRLARACRYQLILARQRMERLSVEAAFAQLRAGLNRRDQRIDTLRFRMEAALRTQFRTVSDQVQQLNARLLRQDLARRLPLMREQYAALESRLLRAVERSLRGPQDRHRLLTQQLTSLSPLAVLSRGYALVYNEAGALVKTAAAVQTGDALTLRLAKGTLGARATDVPPLIKQRADKQQDTDAVTEADGATE